MSQPSPEDEADLNGRNGHEKPLPEEDNAETTERLKSTKLNLTEEMKLQLEKEGWSPARLMVNSIVQSNVFELFMSFVVVCNAVLMMVEADAGAVCAGRGDCIPEWIIFANITFLALYSCEALLRIFSERGKYLHSRWNLIDIFIVFSGYVDFLLYLMQARSNALLSIVRMLRVGRVMRMVKLLRSSPELHKLAVGFAGTMKTIFWGFVMITGVVAVFALMAVELINPVSAQMPWGDDGEWCLQAFSSVLTSMLFFFQTHVAADAWGDCIVPLIMQFPATVVVFAFSLMTIQVGFVNLILSVIVDSAQKARDDDALARIEEKRRQEEGELESFKGLMHRIDQDDNGTVSLQELLRGFDYDKEMRQRLSSLDIGRKDLEALFELMDSADRGELNYTEFAEHVRKAQTQDTRIQMLTLKLQVNKARLESKQEIIKVQEQLQHVQSSIAALDRKNDEVLQSIKCLMRQDI